MADLRYAWRALRRSPWYSATVVGVLALGLALATVAFAVVDGVLFKPLPYARPQELFLVRADVASAPRIEPPPVSWREIEAWTESVPDLAVTVISTDRLPYGTIGNREYAGAAIDEHFFDVVGARPLLGGFSREDFDWAWTDGTISLQPTLISHRVWLHSYGGDPAIVGRAIITTNRGGQQRGIRVAGVLPPNFVTPVDGREVGALRPLRRGAEGFGREFQMIARIPSRLSNPGVLEALLGATRRLAQQPPLLDPHSPAGEQLQRTAFDDVRLVPVSKHLAARERPSFALVFAGAALLLLLSCMNVAGLAAARNIERRRELAVKRALGASRVDVLRGLLTEIGILMTLGMGLSLILVKPMLLWTLDLLPTSIALLKDPAVDFRVFVATALFAIICTALVTVWPARAAASIRVPSILGGAMTSTRRVRRSNAVFVASQVALGFVLLTAGGLTLASLAAAYRNDTGFGRDRLVLLELTVTESSGSHGAIETLRTLPSLLRDLPGVEQVAVSTINPLFAQRANAWSAVVPQHWSGPIEGVVSRQVCANFFEVLGLRLIEGRWPAAGEWQVAQPVALVSETAARMLWPDQPALGRMLIARSSPMVPKTRTVIGVVADARYAALDAPPLGDIYLPDPLAERGRYGAFFHVLTSQAAGEVLPVMLTALAGRGLFVAQASTHEDAVFASVKHRVLPAWLFGSLGFGALVTMGVGVLGLLAMSAAQRTRELGIRVALGATTTRLIAMLLVEQLGAVLMGLVAGAFMSAWFVRLIKTQLYGVRPYDPTVWLGVALTLVVVALLGTLLPSMRATRADPVQALRID